MAAEHHRFLAINAPNYATWTFRAPSIKRNSFVIITAAEAAQDPGGITRFIGDAKPMMVGNIAPFDGGVNFVVFWAGNFPKLSVYSDITVFDPNDPADFTCWGC